MIDITTASDTIKKGDVITMEGVPHYPWIVRLAAWLCRFKLPRKNVLQSFVVTSGPVTSSPWHGVNP